jgi:DNA-binding CsgD family transcriptional regulator
MSLIPHDLASLWADMAGFSAGEADAALVHLLRFLADRVQGRGAYWLAAIRMAHAPVDDVLGGWRPAAIRHLDSSPEHDRFFKTSQAEIERGVPDASTIAHARQAGHFRAVLLRDLMPPEWFSSPYYRQVYEARGVIDTVWTICPVSADAEAYYAWHRTQGQAPFTNGDRDWLAAALLGIPAFHRTIMLSYGLRVAERPLTPTERRVLRFLLTDRTEKQIAAALGLGVRTTHHHVTAIFQKFGVRGRAGLVALWLGPAATTGRDTPAD